MLKSTRREQVDCAGHAVAVQESAIAPLTLRIPEPAARPGEPVDFSKLRLSTQRILGVQAVGSHVSELSGEFAMALEMGATLEDVAGVIHAHPTLSEAFSEASLSGLGRAIHL